jgi:hypothetical protein
MDISKALKEQGETGKGGKLLAISTLSGLVKKIKSGKEESSSESGSESEEEEEDEDDKLPWHRGRGRMRGM